MAFETSEFEGEKRKFTRIPFEIKVSLAMGDDVIKSTRLKNISLGGMYVQTDASFLPGTECVAAIEMVGASSRLSIQAEAEVVRNEEDGLALSFTKIDLDSLIHLRHLIAIHSADPATIDKEYFSEWMDRE